MVRQSFYRLMICFILALSLSIVPMAAIAQETSADGFYIQVTNYPTLNAAQKAAVKENIFSSVTQDYNAASLKSKLVFLGKNHEKAVIEELWPVMGLLSGDAAADAIMETFIEHNFSVSELFYSGLRQRFGEIAGITQTKSALQTYLNSNDSFKREFAYGLLEKGKASGAAELFKAAYHQVLTFEHAKQLFRLIVLLNNQEAYIAAKSVLETVESDARFTDDVQKRLMVNPMVMFSAPEIKPLLLADVTSSNYYIQTSAVHALGNYSGQDVVNVLQQLYDSKEATLQKRSKDEKPSREDVLFGLIKQSLSFAKTNKPQSERETRDNVSSYSFRAITRDSDPQKTLSELAAAYSPVMRLSAGGDDGSDPGTGDPGVNLKKQGYTYTDYIPMSVNDLINNPNKMPKLKTNSGEEELSSVIGSLGSYTDANAYIDFSPLGTSIISMDEIEKGYISLGPTPTVYWYGWYDAKKIYPYAVQYWFFYFYNDWASDHAGDWETITIFFDTSGLPQEVSYSTHYEARRHFYSNLEVSGQHPHVFVSNGGHGSYAKKGDTTYYTTLVVGGGKIWGTDNHYGMSEMIFPSDLSMQYKYSLEGLTNKQPSHWINFTGQWGDNDKAPRGPKNRTDAANEDMGFTTIGTYWQNAINKPKKPDDCTPRYAQKIFGKSESGKNETGPWDWADGYPTEMDKSKEPDYNKDVCVKRPELIEVKRISSLEYEFKWKTGGTHTDTSTQYKLVIFDSQGKEIPPLDAQGKEIPERFYSCDQEECAKSLYSQFSTGKYTWAVRAKNTETASAWTDLKEFEVATTGKISVVFVLDQSGSMDSSEWTLEQKGFEKALSSLPANGDIELAIIKFSSNVEQIIGLTPLKSANLDSIKNNLVSSKQQGGSTYMNLAIDEAVNILSKSSAPTKIIFLATDGAPDSQPDTTASATKAKDAGIVLEPIGIGLGTSGETFLNSIASNPPIANPKDFNEFGTVVSNKVFGKVSSSININLSPDTVDFGVLHPDIIATPGSIGVCGNKQTVELINNGNNKVTISELKITGIDASSYKIESVDGKPLNLPFDLGTKVTMPIVVVLSPTTTPSDAKFNGILTVKGEQIVPQLARDLNKNPVIGGEILEKKFADYSVSLSAAIDPNASKCFTLDVVDALFVIEKIDDAGKPLTKAGNPVTENDVNLAIQGNTSRSFFRSGIAADGNARLLIRASTSLKSGTIRFTIPDNAETEALFYSLSRTTNNDIDGKNSIDVPIVTMSDNEGQATVILRAGERFVGNTNVPEVRFNIEACVVDSATNKCSNTIYQDIKEIRAPVVLIHGLWADDTSWEADWKTPNDLSMRESLQNAHFHVGTWNYTNHEGPTVTMPPDQLALAARINLESLSLNELGFASTRADIVGHSMGGLVARKFIYDNKYYKNFLNFHQGAVRRLITLGTPHLGSGIANLILGAMNVVCNDSKACSDMGQIADTTAINSCTTSVTGCNSFVAMIGTVAGLSSSINLENAQALIDLRIGSTLLQKLNSKRQNIPTFAIIGDIGREFQGADWVYTQTGCSYENIFGNFDADGVVSIASQQGNLNIGYFQSFNAPHANLPGIKGETSMPDIVKKVIELLNGPSTSFSETAYLYQKRDTVLAENSVSKPIRSGFGKIIDAISSVFSVSNAYAETPVTVTLSISSNKTEFIPGDTVTFEANVSGGTNISSVVLIDLNDAFWMAEDKTAPYQWTFNTSKQASGNIQMKAVAMVDGKAVESNVVTATIKPDLSKLKNIVFSPNDPIALMPDMTQQLHVKGEFSDGYNRDITSGMGTVYSENIVSGLKIVSGNSPCIEISSSGVVKALSPGKAEVVATNSGYYATVRIVVQGEEGKDYCPDDPNKTEPGACGCGKPETDTDNDGAPDCIDQCPNDPKKAQPGACGCGASESGDKDGDGTPDCIDQCPNDPKKTQPGTCGCGVAETGCSGGSYYEPTYYYAPPANQLPTADKVYVITEENKPVSVKLIGSDPDAPNWFMMLIKPVTYSVVTQPLHGTLSGTAPDLTYTPAAGYIGTDSFTFKLSDGTADSAPATVSLVINPVGSMYVDDSLALNISCAEYQGARYGFKLDYSKSSDPSGLYWKMDTSTIRNVGNTGGSCISVGNDLKISVPAALHRGTTYQFSLNYSPISSDASGHYWKMDLGTFKSR